MYTHIYIYICIDLYITLQGAWQELTPMLQPRRGSEAATAIIDNNNNNSYITDNNNSSNNMKRNPRDGRSASGLKSGGLRNDT